MRVWPTFSFEKVFLWNTLLFIIVESCATRLTANLLMIPPILGDQTAQHGHYKSGGDGIEGESKISGDCSNRWCLSEWGVSDTLWVLLTALGESRLIPQWQSWEQPTKGQSLRTEKQNKEILYVWNIMCHCSFRKHLLFTSKRESSHDSPLKHSHQKSNEKEHLPLLHRCEPKP